MLFSALKDRRKLLRSPYNKLTLSYIWSTTSIFPGHREEGGEVKERTDLCPIEKRQIFLPNVMGSYNNLCWSIWCDMLEICFHSVLNLYPKMRSRIWTQTFANSWVFSIQCFSLLFSPWELLACLCRSSVLVGVLCSRGHVAFFFCEGLWQTRI